jgi:hypothetical protein
MMEFSMEFGVTTRLQLSYFSQQKTHEHFARPCRGLPIVAQKSQLYNRVPKLWCLERIFGSSGSSRNSPGETEFRMDGSQTGVWESG